MQAKSTASQALSLNTWTLQSQKVSDPAGAWIQEGCLWHGTKVVAASLDTTLPPEKQFVGGVTFVAALYAPYINGELGESVDISHSTVALAPSDASGALFDGSNGLQLIKVKEPLSDWSFNITESYDATSGNPTTLNGTMVKSDGSKWILKGQYQGPDTSQTATVTVLPPTVQPPAFVTGKSPNPGELEGLSPIATPEDVGIATGKDGAQFYGGDYMNQLIKHSLADANLALLLGTQETITDPELIAVYNKNQYYFPRAGVHMLCDFLKKNKDGSIPSEITDHLEWKNTLFNRVCSAPATSTPAAGQATSLNPLWDPITMYGLDPVKDAKLIAHLQKDFRKASMETYALGFRKLRPNLANYDQDAAGWFKWYAYFCTSPEQLSRQAILGANAAEISPGGSTLGPGSTRDIINKLTVLKHAAENQNGGNPMPELNIQTVVEALDAANTEHMAYSMYVDDEAMDMINGSAANNPGNEEAFSKSIDAALKAMGEEISQDAANLQSVAINTLYFLMSSTSTVREKLLHLWSKRSPPGVETTRLTYGQVSQGIEMTSLSDHLVPGADGVPHFNGDGEVVQGLNEGGGNLLRRFAAMPAWEKLKAVGKGVWEGGKWLLKLGVHVAAIVGLYEIISGAGSSMSPTQLGTVVCSVAVAGLSAVGKLVGVTGDLFSAVRFGMRKGRVLFGARAWFADVAKPGFVEPLSFAKAGRAFVGNFGHFARTMGLIGCVLNLVSSFDEMSDTGSGSNDPVAAREQLDAKINFSLGVVEGVACTGEIVAEIAGFETVGAICGPIGFLVGLAAFGVTLAEMFESPPDEWQPVKNWLAKAPTDYGSYDADETFTGEAYIIYPLKAFVGTTTPTSPSPSIPVTPSSTGTSSVETSTVSTANSDAVTTGSSSSASPGAGAQDTRKVAPAQETAAGNLSLALQGLSKLVQSYEPGCPAASPMNAFQRTLNEGIKAGQPWASANDDFVQATNQYVASIANLVQAKKWSVQVLNSNQNNQQDSSNPFDGDAAQINTTYLTLQGAMAQQF